MSLNRPVIQDGPTMRQIARGDTLAGADILPGTISTAAITITGAQLAQGYILRNPAGSATDTIDSAANIIASLLAGTGLNNVQPGTTFKCKWIVSTAQTTTVQATANTGVTVTNGAIAASGVKDFLVTVTNGTPAKTFTGNTTNASAVITGMTQEQTSQLSVGMVVTNAVNGLQGTTIISIQPGVGVTLSGNANATSSTPGVAIAFSPTVTVYGIGQGVL